VSDLWSGHRAEYYRMKDEIDGAIQRVIESGAYQRGEEVRAFEAEFAAYCGSQYAVGTNSCYMAMFVALLACGVGPGDEVITVANTDIATTAAISHTGAKFVWVDIDEDTYNIDPARIEDSVTSRTKAILAVHMYGLPADLDPIMDTAERHSLWVIEDAALAVGARYHGARAGSVGDVGCFSFVFGKGLGTFGDAGMVVTDNPELADRMRGLNLYNVDTMPQAQVGDIELLKGFNYTSEGYYTRLIPLHAAVLREKLPRLDDWIARRREVAERYMEGLRGLGIVLPFEPKAVEHIYRNYAVRVVERDRVRRELAERGIPTGIHYVPPLHLQPVYRGKGYGPGDLPVTEHVAGQIMTLPIHPWLREEDIDRVVGALRDSVTKQTTESD
jgi:dTDP-4-amino-4,6-dideoxygalactose transaminase